MDSAALHLALVIWLTQINWELFAPLGQAADITIHRSSLGVSFIRCEHGVKKACMV